MGVLSTKEGRHAVAFCKKQGDSLHKASKVIDYVTTKMGVKHSKNRSFKFLVGMCRILKYSKFNEDDNLAAFKTVMTYVSDEGHRDSFDENLNGLTFGELKDMFIAKAVVSQRQLLEGKTFESKGYRIRRIDTREECKEYSPYVSWCTTKGSFSSYDLDTVSQCYICEKDGFEKLQEPEVTPADAPFDEYGMSLVSVIVGMDGEPAYITTRWNHKHDGENNKSFYTPSDVSEKLGVNFYETFKPNTSYFNDLNSMIEDNIRRYEHSHDRHALDALQFILKPFKSRWGGLHLWYAKTRQAAAIFQYHEADNSVELMYGSWFKDIELDEEHAKYFILKKRDTSVLFLKCNGVEIREEYIYSWIYRHNISDGVIFEGCRQIEYNGDNAMPLFDGSPSFQVFREVIDLDGVIRGQGENYTSIGVFDYENGPIVRVSKRLEGMSCDVHNFIDIKSGKLLLDKWYYYLSPVDSFAHYYKGTLRYVLVGKEADLEIKVDSPNKALEMQRLYNVVENDGQRLYDVANKRYVSDIPLRHVSKSPWDGDIFIVSRFIEDCGRVYNILSAKGEFLLDHWCSNIKYYESMNILIAQHSVAIPNSKFKHCSHMADYYPLIDHNYNGGCADMTHKSGWDEHQIVFYNFIGKDYKFKFKNWLQDYSFTLSKMDGDVGIKILVDKQLASNLGVDEGYYYTKDLDDGVFTLCSPSTYRSSTNSNKELGNMPLELKNALWRLNAETNKNENSFTCEQLRNCKENLVNKALMVSESMIRPQTVNELWMSHTEKQIEDIRPYETTPSTQFFCRGISNRYNINEIASSLQSPDVIGTFIHQSSFQPFTCGE